MSTPSSPAQTSLQIDWIPVTLIRESPRNPRKHFDPAKLDELSLSIREKGVIEPAIVRRVGSGYELVAGARRFRATQLAGLAALPAIVRDLDDSSALEFAVIENGQREDVSPIEEAEGYEALRQMDPKRFTVAEIAAKVGKNESYVYRRLKLLTLEERYTTALSEGRLTIAHAEALCRLTAKQRREADEKSLIWRNLFNGDRTANDLAPLNELLDYIRTRTHFEPATTDTRHFQPALADQIDAIAEEAGEEPEQVAASLIELSVDPMARARLGAKPTDVIPLPPSKWREAKKPCGYVKRGVITHGGEPKVLDVCTAKTKCTVHFPELKKKAAAAKKGSASTKSSAKDSAAAKQREAEKAKAAEAQKLADAKAWNALVPHFRDALVEWSARITLTAELFKAVTSSRRTEVAHVVRHFGVKCTDKNLGQIAALMMVDLDNACDDPKAYNFSFDWQSAKTQRADFLASCKRIGFNAGPVEQRVKAEQAKAKKSAAK